MKEELLYGKKSGGGGSAKRKPQWQPPQDEEIEPAINISSAKKSLEKGEIEIIEAPVVADVPVIA